MDAEIRRMVNDYKALEAEFKSASEQNYRGFKIVPLEGTQMGHTTNRGTLARAGIGTKRKFSGYEIFYPDSNASKLFSSLKEAKKYIDSYLE